MTKPAPPIWTPTAVIFLLKHNGGAAAVAHVELSRVRQPASMRLFGYLPQWDIPWGNILVADVFRFFFFAGLELGCWVGPLWSEIKRLQPWVSPSSGARFWDRNESGSHRWIFRVPRGPYLLWSVFQECHGPSPWSISALAAPATSWHRPVEMLWPVPTVSNQPGRFLFPEFDFTLAAFWQQTFASCVSMNAFRQEAQFWYSFQ